MIRQLAKDKIRVKPTSLVSVSYVVSLIKKFYPFIDTPQVIFDFTGIIYAKSVATAVFARELREIILYRVEHHLISQAEVNIDLDTTCRYLDHIGFFDFIGVQHKGSLKKIRKQLEQQVEGRIPIIEYNYLYFQRGYGFDPMDESMSYYQAEEGASGIIEKESIRIVQALFGHDAGLGVLAYCIREALRNCYEHSKADKYYVLGQTWNNGKSELVIMDYGNGLLKTLKRKYPDLQNERDAIQRAVEPGVSETDFNGKNVYTNSGFGLYVLCQLALRFGKIYIASNESMVAYGKAIKVHDVKSKGTMVAMQFKKLPEDFGAALEEIIKKGRERAQTGTYPISPSLLTRQYTKNGVVLEVGK